MKNQICILISAFLLTLAASPMTAQERRQDGNHRKWEESMRAEKIAYFTEALELSTEEAEKFWPVYNRCEKEKQKAFDSQMKALRSLDAAVKENKSDNEISSLLNPSFPKIRQELCHSGQQSPGQRAVQRALLGKAAV